MRNSQPTAPVRLLNDFMVAGKPNWSADFSVLHAPDEDFFSDKLDAAVPGAEPDSVAGLPVIAKEYYFRLGCFCR